MNDFLLVYFILTSKFVNIILMLFSLRILIVFRFVAFYNVLIRTYTIFFISNFNASLFVDENKLMIDFILWQNKLKFLIKINFKKLIRYNRRRYFCLIFVSSKQIMICENNSSKEILVLVTTERKNSVWCLSLEEN